METQRNRLRIQRRGQYTGINATGNQRGEGLGRPTHLDEGDISRGFETKMSEGLNRKVVRIASNPRHSVLFPLEILEPVYPGLGQNTVGEDVLDAAYERKVGSSLRKGARAR